MICVSLWWHSLFLCCRSFDPSPYRGGDQVGPCEKWYHGVVNPVKAGDRIKVTIIFHLLHNITGVFGKNGKNLAASVTMLLCVALLRRYSDSNVQLKPSAHSSVYVYSK